MKTKVAFIHMFCF